MFILHILSQYANRRICTKTHEIINEVNLKKSENDQICPYIFYMPKRHK